jgi:UDP-2,4-diacetamido-2,4,6-trideoxy-beta-L-altropyranose hydrolase
LTPLTRIAFRADASTEIGTGHVMRCLTLADALAERGVECHFLSRDLPGNLCEKIAARGHHLHRLAAPFGGAVADPEGPTHAGWLGLGWRDDAADCAPILATVAPDWLVMDHYALDARWQRVVLPAGCRLLVIDDLADRPHIPAVLLDQNLGREAADYEHLVPAGCTRLIGPRFALLRPEFAALRAHSLARRREGELRRLLISMGGVDRDNATGAILDALAGIEHFRGVDVRVILGGAAPWLVEVQKLAATMPFPCDVLVDRADMAELLAETDLAIGAAGSSTWERCCLGVPTLIMVLADNQAAIAKALEQEGLGVLLGPIGVEGWEKRLPEALDEARPSVLGRMSRRAAACCDGSGVEVVCDLIVSGKVTVRRATLADAGAVWTWRYADGAEWHYRSATVTSLSDHIDWFARAIDNPSRHLFIAEMDGRAIGHVRVDVDAEAARTGWIGICMSPAERGKGLAPLALRAAMEATRKSGLNRFNAEVHEDNAPSRRLFRGLGFSPDGQDGSFVRYTLSLDPTE